MVAHPISHLTAENFGAFPSVNVQLSPGLNVIVGDNSTGKSQLLKSLYSSTKALNTSSGAFADQLQSAIASKLLGCFRPQALGRLVRRTQGNATARIELAFAEIDGKLEFGLSTRRPDQLDLLQAPASCPPDKAVYLPPNELLSLGASFVSLYNNYDTGFDETWRDTVELLLLPPRKGRPEGTVSDIMPAFAQLLNDGRVVEDNGQFYLSQPGIGNLEAPLLAEGHRKLASVVRLISNGVLLDGGYLFWDEPEANLNPASQRAVAQALVFLARQGSQVFVATHSTFLMRELQMGLGDTPAMFIGLKKLDRGQLLDGDVLIEQASDLDELSFIAALDAESNQADRYLVW